PRGDAKKYSQGNVSAVGVTYDGHTALTRVDWPSAVVEGGSSGPGQMVREFDQVVFSAPLNVVQGPVKTQFGYHLLEVTSRQD
ncbi:peptidyl-prolyl cis-trans isomerase, partial [Pseudomonas aeruginosa]|uniref:peptidylprolyl isomerase n=1 Tax=Pseudomonas aeruginosa TaxID=287 RepID=UPI0021AB5DA8